MGQNLHEALDLALRADKLKPDNGYITDTVAWIHFKLGNYTKAVEYLERAVKLLPDDPIINEHLGDAYAKAGQRQKALDTYLKVKKLGPEDESGLNKKIEDLKKQLH